MTEPSDSGVVAEAAPNPEAALDSEAAPAPEAATTSGMPEPDLEPSVINYDMINESILDSGYKGEAGRLQKLDPINYENIKTLRLEFKNILRIDHLWILPNLTKLSLNYNKIDQIENLETLTSLKELDLSFNYIEKIENLETLTKLKSLSLFNNLIKKLENLDALENLVILSIGNNKINTYDGIERFRFLKKLRCLNLQGNPIAQDKENPFRLYIAAFLPNLRYYEYVYIKDDEREEGGKKYDREVRDLQESEREELEFRKKREKYNLDETRLSDSFVEHLNEHQLFESYFEGDKEGDALRMIGEESDDIVKDYKSDTYSITQKLFNMGLERHEERRKEIAMFTNSIESSQSKTQKAGQQIIEDFLKLKDILFVKARGLLIKAENLNLQNLDDQSSEVKENSEEIVKLVQSFNGKMDEAWQQLMEDEVQLFESVQEAIAKFALVIRDMISNFIEQTQVYFVQLRDVAANFSETLSREVTLYVTYMSASAEDDQVPNELKLCLEDKENIFQLVVGMKDNHIKKIDAREDKLVTRATTWASDLIDQMEKDEVSRNRSKIMEVNYFLDQMREAFDVLQNEVREDFFRDHD